jgi:2-dehydropantoate 2-reductase
LITLSADFKTALWRKLCLNSAGVINALLLQPAGVMRDEKIGELAYELVRECVAVGRAEGAVLDDSLLAGVVQAYRSAPPDSVNSLHADRQAGRPMEIDARNGVIVRLGRKHGIPTPCNRMAVALLEAMVRGR